MHCGEDLRGTDAHDAGQSPSGYRDRALRCSCRNDYGSSINLLFRPWGDMDPPAGFNAPDCPFGQEHGAGGTRFLFKPRRDCSTVPQAFRSGLSTVFVQLTE
jgi:hypothetical protein